MLKGNHFIKIITAFLLTCIFTNRICFAFESKPTILTHHNSTVDNIQFHWVEGGDPKQVAILFLAGWPQTSFAWQKVMISMASRFHVLSIDLPGIGESGFSPTKAYDAKSISLAIRSLVQSLKLGPIHLVGHDVGAWVAFAFALQFQEDLLSLVLLDTKLPGIFPDPDPFVSVDQNIQSWQLSFNQLPLLPEILVQGKERELFTWLVKAKSVHPDKVLADLPIFLKYYRQAGRLSASFEYYRSIPQNIEMNRTFAATKKLNIRILAIGADKGVGGTLLTGLKKIAPNAEGTVLENCGHYLPEECDKGVIESLGKFIR